MPRKTPPKSITVPSGAVVSLGDMVSYYHNGWRVGYLDEIVGTGASVKVRPLKEGARSLLLPTNDLKEITK